MTYANGDMFEGEWANDMKNGRGVYYYPTGAVYEGVWQEDIAKCGAYKQDAALQIEHPLPALQLESPAQVLKNTEDNLPPVVYY